MFKLNSHLPKEIQFRENTEGVKTRLTMALIIIMQVYNKHP